jgi:hypothetical protein
LLNIVEHYHSLLLVITGAVNRLGLSCAGYLSVIGHSRCLELQGSVNCPGFDTLLSDYSDEFDIPDGVEKHPPPPGYFMCAGLELTKGSKTAKKQWKNFSNTWFDGETESCWKPFGVMFVESKTTVATPQLHTSTIGVRVEWPSTFGEAATLSKAAHTSAKKTFLIVRHDMCFPLRFPVDICKPGSKFESIFKPHRRVYLLEGDRNKKHKSIYDMNKKDVPTKAELEGAQQVLQLVMKR